MVNKKRKTNKNRNNKYRRKNSGRKTSNRRAEVKRQRIIAVIVLVVMILMVARLLVSCNAKDDNVIYIPDGCGTYATREWDLNYYECAEGSNQHKVDLLWKEYGTEDDKGFQKLYGRYLIACTDTFGEVGDKIDFYMSDGTVLKCIIYDNKSREKTFYDNKPANKWGHDKGRVVLEFVGSAKLGTSPYKKLGLDNECTVKAIRLSNIIKKSQ